jgi:thiol-disulfide isomerase/thioredoxin
MFRRCLLSLLLLSSPALAGELTVPANTAYHDEASTAGLQRALWFGQLGAAGALSCAVDVELVPGAEAVLSLRALGQESNIRLTGGSGVVRVDFHDFAVAAPGYVRFELVQLEGLEAKPVALVLDGAPLEGAQFNLEPRKNAASVHLFYPLPDEVQRAGVEAFYCEVTAEEDPVWTYYMATGWHRGYFGMQVNSATERRIIFSVWDSGGEAVDRGKVADSDRVQLVARGEDVFTGSFGNEGTGGHSHLVFDWKTGETQRFLVTAERDDATHTTFSGYYFRPDKQRWMLISSWRAPKEGGLLRGLYSFSENFGGENGHLLRRARYGNEWVRHVDGTWHELVRASFSFDGTGKANRLDRYMGVNDGEFFLSHGGFVEGTGAYGEVFERPETGTPPDVDFGLGMGSWRATLASPGGELPFELVLRRGVPGSAAGEGGAVRVRGARLAAEIHNGSEVIATGAVELSEEELVIHLEPYDSRLVARIAPDGQSLDGHWEKMAGPGREARLEFHAHAGAAARFSAADEAVEITDPERATRLDGRWAVDFDSDENLSVGLFKSLPDGRAEGTFLTTLGDYRYLAGSFDGQRLRLSCFDGGHAFLFDATLDETGALRGDFWSRDSWHETWTAKKDTSAALPDSFGLTTWDASAQLGDFAFPDGTGNQRSLDDPEFRGKARLITLFGTWCPNCNDEADYLAELQERYGERGLKILGLAFELDENLARSAAQVERYQARHSAHWPVLFAGISDKAQATEALSALDRVRSYPTVLFVDANGQVRAVHTGYAGPATGAAHDRMRERYETLIEELLAAQ